MASLSHFPCFFSPSSHKLFPLPLPLPLHSLHTDHTLLHIHHHHHRNPAIFASSIKKPRASRKVRSNADLCNDIREFLSVAGFPDGHVPSMKELSQHGRQDLANIIRRRGYKLIKELLATSTKSDGKGSDPEEVLVEKQDISGECEYESTDDGFGILNEIAANDGKKFVESEDVTKELSSFGQEHSEWLIGRNETAKILTESSSPSKQVVLHASGNNTSRNDYFSSEQLCSGDHEDLDVETIKMENQTEVDHLKFMLHQKELELSLLKEQIEKEKHTLSILQTKAETEISKAQKLTMDKDAELHAAEESLSGLEEVEIQYRGVGETVELAGSFNGWHHRITMDPQPSSSILDPIGSRKSRLWTTVLWLYPGTYEIKFIVDGQWRIDPQRESVTSGSIQNNVLRVDR